MLEPEMIDMVKVMVADDRYDGIIPTYLRLAKDRVLAHLFPMDREAEWDMVPDAYHAQTCEIAVYLINKRGAEGETLHSENGTERRYASASVPAAMFAGMVPFAAVPK